MAGIWVVAEHADTALELLTPARQVADSLGGPVVAVWLGRQEAPPLFAHGADEVLVCTHGGDDQPLEAQVPVLVAEALQAQPEAILVGASLRGREVAARMAAALGTGLGSSCVALRVRTDGLVEMDRLVFGGRAVQTVVCTTRPQMATVAPRTFSPAPPVEGRSGTVRTLPAPPPSPVTVVERKPKPAVSGDVAGARVVVCVGRGMEREEDLEMARRLADILGGEVGCTRPIAEEYHWLPEHTYIGLSGQQVKPELYIGIGVSGQIQHVIGITDARVIVAINRDEKAPIFEMSDFGIVGDLYQVVPRLVDELTRALGK
ncbi:MAG: electron transfer flavoprotein subunit alpha/FixB family protein [Syntrophomonadaceae bacterium]|nr:electron transfer flavoprotein subunit alpha/FixB family protein [Syntrophomonadaceae bacterium]